MNIANENSRKYRSDDRHWIAAVHNHGLFTSDAKRMKQVPGSRSFFLYPGSEGGPSNGGDRHCWRGQRRENIFGFGDKDDSGDTRQSNETWQRQRASEKQFQIVFCVQRKIYISWKTPGITAGKQKRDEQYIKGGSSPPFRRGGGRSCLYFEWKGGHMFSLVMFIF